MPKRSNKSTKVKAAGHDNGANHDADDGLANGNHSVDSAAADLVSAVSPNQADVDIIPVPTKRGRGRPPSSSKSQNAAAITSAEPIQLQTGPTRQAAKAEPKVITPNADGVDIVHQTSATTTGSSTAATKRGRGRPPSSGGPVVSPAKQKGKRGRPPRTNVMLKEPTVQPTTVNGSASAAAIVEFTHSDSDGAVENGGDETLGKPVSSSPVERGRRGRKPGRKNQSPDTAALPTIPGRRGRKPKALAAAAANSPGADVIAPEINEPDIAAESNRRRSSRATAEISSDSRQDIHSIYISVLHICFLVRNEPVSAVT